MVPDEAAAAYPVEQAAATATGDAALPKKGAKTKAKAKGANGEPKPKRAPSAYILYCSEARPKLPEGLRVPEQAKLLGAQWKTLDAVEKARFEGMAADAKLQANAR